MFYFVQLIVCVLVAALTRKAKISTAALIVLPASVLAVFLSTYFLLNETNSNQYTGYYAFFWFIYGIPFVGICFLFREIINYFENLIKS